MFLLGTWTIDPIVIPSDETIIKAFWKTRYSLWSISFIFTFCLGGQSLVSLIREKRKLERSRGQEREVKREVKRERERVQEREFKRERDHTWMREKCCGRTSSMMKESENRLAKDAEDVSIPLFMMQKMSDLGFRLGKTISSSSSLFGPSLSLTLRQIPESSSVLKA